jgi:Holliday junction DNA helicase RuvB
VYSPRTIKEYIGQKDVLSQIGVAMRSSVIQKQPFPHTLLAGFGGTGKTTLAKLIADTLGDRLVMRMPATLKSDRDVWDLFNDEMKDESPLIYFMDEIHRMDVKIQEELYIPLENGIIIRKSGNANLRGTYELKPFSFIGATTNPGRLTEPFRSRFGLILYMQPYTQGEMRRIIQQAATQSGVQIESEAIVAIAKRARASPRIANHLLDRCRDMMLSSGLSAIDAKVTEACFELMGVDGDGLNATDRKYLRALYEVSRPIGAASLEPILHIDKQSIVNSVEPYLVESGWVSLTRSGRELTKKGIDFVEQNFETGHSGLRRIR